MKILLVFLLSYWTIFQNAVSEFCPGLSEESAEVQRVIRNLATFYRCVVESVLTGCITAWYGNTNAFEQKILQKITFQEIKDAIGKTKEIDSLKSKVSQLEKEVSTLQNYVPSVIFHAQVSYGSNPVGPTKLIFDQVDINNGQAYNASSGNFIAPMNGIFYFSYSLLAQTNSLDTLVQLMKNGVAQSYIHSLLHSDQAQTASMSIILPLVRGDIVWVKLLQGSTWSERNSLNFQGFLLKRT